MSDQKRLEKQSFEENLLESIDEGLKILGESCRHPIYYYIEKSCQVKREEIPDRIEAFDKCLEGLLGAGAKAVEKLIAKNLYSGFGLNFEEHENWTLVEYVNNAKAVGGK